nr:hypothetical protein [Amycolatopsis antarctica]
MDPGPPGTGDGARRPARSRPSPWNRRRDRVAAAVIAVACLVAGLLVWTFSDVRATTSQRAAPPAAVPPAQPQVPGTLTEMWQAPSPATPTPVGEADAVVTGADGEVAGRDPMTGEVRWRYGRDLDLCTIGGAWNRAVAVYRKDSGCSEVTALDPRTGARTAQRNGDAELGTRLVNDGSHLTATGTTLLNTWRDDLVKSMEYGRVSALVNPDKQPRTGCTYGSVAATGGKVGVIERCPGDQADRLTVYKSSGGESDEPKPLYSSVLAGRSAKVIAMSGEVTAVALPEQKLLVVYGKDGNQTAAYPLDLAPGELAQDPPGGVVPTAKGAAGIYWFTGSRTVALAKENLAPRWTLDGATGTGTLFGNQFVLPIDGGLAVVEEADGRTVRTIGVDRRGYPGEVRLGTLGSVLLEQRGETVAALR